MRISDWSSDVCSSDLKQSQSEEKSAVGNFPTHMLKRVGNSPTMAVPRTAKTEGRVGNFPTPFLRNGRNPSNLVVGDFPTHTAVPAGSANSLVPIGWWASDRMGQAAFWAAAVQTHSQVDREIGRAHV